MSVHEERANVGRSIQAENAEASSLLLFSTNLSDKEQREKPVPTWMSEHNWLSATKAYFITPNSFSKKISICWTITKRSNTFLDNRTTFQSRKCRYYVYSCLQFLCSHHTLFTRNKTSRHKPVTPLQRIHKGVSQSPMVTAVIWNPNWYLDDYPDRLEL